MQVSGEGVVLTPLLDFGVVVVGSKVVKMGRCVVVVGLVVVGTEVVEVGGVVVGVVGVGSSI